MTVAAFPYRLVDAFAVGWHQTSTPGTYQSDDVSQEPLTLEALTATRGPWRPVIMPPEKDAAALQAALTGAGRKALITLAVVLHDIAVADMDAHRGEHGRGSILTAGRGGSWESVTLRQFVWSLGYEVPASRVDAAAGLVLAEILGRWTGDEAGYVELAENLAAILGRLVDTAPDDGGMRTIADQWIMRHEGFETLRGWALSLSEHHGPSTWYP